MERHKNLRQIARLAWAIPGCRTSLRVLSRFTIQSLPLSLKNRQRVYNFIAADTLPSHELDCFARLPFGGSVKLKLDLHDDLSRAWYYWGYSGYEPATVRLFCRLLAFKSCVFDIGANVGYYTLLAARFLEGRGEVHAFEPYPAVFHWLSRNVGLNAFQCARLNRVALTDVDGEQPLFIPSDHAGTNASLVQDFTEQESFVMARTMRFDSYCTENVLRPVDLIKIDAEGAEASVLRGAGALLDRWTPDVICEVLEPFEKELNSIFSAKAYRKFLITECGLQEREHLKANRQWRDYYLSREPVLS